ESFIESRVLDDLQMKVEDVLKFQTTGTHLAAPNEFQIELPLLAANAIAATENPLTSVSYHPETLTSCAEVGCYHIATVVAATLLPELSLTRCRHLSRTWWLQVLTISVSQRLSVLCGPTIASDKRAHSGSLVVDAGLGISVHAWHHFLTCKGEKIAIERAMTKEEFPDECSALAPKFAATQAEVPHWSGGEQVLDVPVQEVPAEDWHIQSATKDRSVAAPAQATEGIEITNE
ncbi:40S ribosomal protein SA, partial [Galemys pyrenaicus]